MMRKIVSKRGVTVRTLILLLVLAFFSVCPALASGPTDFESFIKTREVLATLYFDANADTLSMAERNRLADTIQQLRKAQKNGRMIRVEGFSSREGDQEKNFILSFFRARSVADIIEAQGLASEIALTGYGDLKAGSADHSRERRVEVASYVKPVGMKRVRVADTRVDPETLPNNAEQVRQKILKIDSYRLDQAIRSKVDDKSGLAEQRDELDDNLQQPNLSKTREQLQKEDLERGYSLWRQSVAPDKPQKVAQASSNDLNHGFTQYIKSVTSGTSRGLTQAKKSDDELQRGYSQSAETASPGSSPGLTQAKKSDDELQRGYSQSAETAIPGSSPGLTQSKKSDDELQRGYSQVEKVTIPDSAPGVTMLMPIQPPAIDALMIEQAIMEKIGVEPTEPSGTVSQIDLNYQQ